MINMNEETFPCGDFFKLFISYLVLNNINRIDVIDLGYFLSEVYYLGDYRYLLSEFKMRETIKHDMIIDIDSVLMDAYLFGYMDDKSSSILISKEEVMTNILPKYDAFTNKIVSNLACLYVSRLQSKDLKYNNSYIGDYFYHPFKKIKKQH